MKIRLGYACVSETLKGITSSTPYPYSKFLKDENHFEILDQIIRSNLSDLEHLIDYNIKNNIHVFRLSTNIIPLVTVHEFTYDYLTPYLDIYRRIGKKIKDADMRVDFHPDQYTILNSTRMEVLENTKKSLIYQYQLLDALGVKNKILLLHIGSNVFGKKASISRFIHQFQTLPKEIQNCIAIENDDKIFTIEDTLEVSKKLNVPIVLDYHHYLCNQDGDILPHLDEILSSWRENTPKIHFSSPKSKLKKEFRSHHDYIDSDHFILFLEMIKKYPYDVDIMIEAKKKDEALFRLVRELKYKTNYEFIDETTFLLK